MTTIAWRGSELASDSALTYGSSQSKAIKIIKLPGVAYGLAGDASSICQFIDMVRDGGDPFDTKIKGDFDCLMLTPDGCFLVQNGSYPIPWMTEFWAIGSGSDYAIGAMAASKRVTARRAVEIAAEHDTNSALPVQLARVRRRRA